MSPFRNLSNITWNYLISGITGIFQHSQHSGNRWKQNILVLITVTLYIDSERFIKSVFSKKIFLGTVLKM